MEMSIPSVSQTVRDKIVISTFLNFPISIFGQTMGVNRVARIKVLLLRGIFLLQMALPMAYHRDQCLTHRKG